MASTHVDQLRDLRLYFVCDARRERGDLPILLEAALRGGVDIVQLRDKDADEGELRKAAGDFRRAASRHGVPFIVNDDPELAVELDADGVHVGQDDVSVARARQIVGPDRIIGLSTHDADQLADAQEGPERPDYLSVGPVWETPTKAGRPAAGLDYVRHAASAGELPWFAIGSINASSIESVISAGATRFVVVRALRDAGDPESAAAELRERIFDLAPRARTVAGAS